MMCLISTSNICNHLNGHAKSYLHSHHGTLVRFVIFTPGRTLTETRTARNLALDLSREASSEYLNECVHPLNVFYVLLTDDRQSD